MKFEKRALKSSRTLSFQFISGNQMLDLWRATTCQTLVRFWDTHGTRKKTLEFSANPFAEDQPVTKWTILSYLEAIYNPLGIVSPTMAQGKNIYRQACDEKKGRNAEVSTQLRDEWFKWTKQLKTVEIPRSGHFSQRDYGSATSSLCRC